MVVRNLNLNSTTDELDRQLFQQIRRMNGSLHDHDRFLQEWSFARSILEAMPLATHQFDLAHSRLKNANRYVQSGETGAAKYELRLLAGSLDVDLSGAEQNVSENSNLKSKQKAVSKNARSHVRLPILSSLNSVASD